MGGRRVERDEGAGRNGPEARVRRPAPNNLPVQTTPLVGRDAELAALEPMLLRADVPLLTLTGTGGIGKTRLGLRLASLLVDDFSDGVFVVSLAPLRDPRLVANAVATALGVRDASPASPLERLSAHLRPRQLLLLLDNFEHLMPAATDVAALLASCPYLKVLVTSRARLRITGEHEFPLAPLGLPPRPHDLADPVDLEGYAAVKLFRQRAQAVHPGFGLSSRNAADVVEICRKLDGLPLAIELAAARSKLFPPSALLERLERRLEFLTGGARDLPERQQTLRTTIDWSHDLLTDSQRVLFRRLAVFGTEVGLPAIASVCGAPEDLPDLVDDIGQLLDHGLVRQVEASCEAVCVQMLETIREYALEKLAESGEEDHVREAHARFCLRWAERLAAGAGPDAEHERLRRLEAELSDFHAALRWALRRGAPELALRLAASLAGVWENNAYLADGRAWLDEVLALEVEGTDLVALRARLCHDAALLATRQSDWQAATAWAEESVRLCRSVEDRRGEAHALLTLALIATMQGHRARSIVLHERVVPMFEALEDTPGLARALHNFGLAHRFDEPQKALELGRRSLELYRASGQARGAAQALNLIAWAQLGLGDSERARECFVESLAESWRLRARWVTGYVLQGLADAVLRSGDGILAARLLSISVRTFQTVEAPVRQVRLEQHFVELRDRLRLTLGEAAYQRAWEDGQRTTVEEALAQLARPTPTSAAPVLETPQAAFGLTPRESQVLDLVAEGLTDRQIARRLSISPATASRHVGNILGKTGAPNRVGLARLALTRK